MRVSACWYASATAALLAACAGPAQPTATAAVPAALKPIDPIRLLERLTWGTNSASLTTLNKLGTDQYLTQQLHPAASVPLPAEAAARIDALEISHADLATLARTLEQERKTADGMAADDQKKAAQQAYQQHLNRLGKEAATRALLRELYSPDQLKEQMAWFWLNHFSVHQYKSNLRALVGDYDEQIRAHALGRFRDLLGVVVHHPAMLRYLDNDQNAAGHLNENFARELMELHTLGVNAGYSQRDVQELARVLTGLGVNMADTAPAVRPEHQKDYVRQGLFEFNPNRHDYGDKQLLGETIHGSGLAEAEHALDKLARHPATAAFICRKLAGFWVKDNPPPALVASMAHRFQETDGQIAAVLDTMFRSPEFRDSLGKKFKDPAHYVVSAVRFAYDDKIILNPDPMFNWLNRMGEPRYGHPTPDGYPMEQTAWASAGQMTTRFEIAKAIGSGNAGLFKLDGPQPSDKPGFPQLANAIYYGGWQKLLGPATRTALDQAVSPQEWNTYLLASPEFMLH